MSVFIVFEGGDAVGKSTQSGLLGQALAAAGVPHLITRQPGGTTLGAQLRHLILDPDGVVSARAEALMYAADKAQHVEEVVLPALGRGEVVVSDRYVDSMIAYQGAGRALDMAEVERLARWATGSVVPDLTILLDADPAQAVASIAKKDRLEGAGDEFHQRTRQFYLDLAEAHPERYLVLEARGYRAAIAERVWQRVRPLVQAHVGGSWQD
ncbi:MAG: dTMP kinase [Arachnia sp.]